MEKRLLYSISCVLAAVFLIPFVSAAEQCAITTSPVYNHWEEDKHIYDVHINMSSQSASEQAVLVYCGDGSYPQVTYCSERYRDTGNADCRVRCSYAQDGERTIRVVEKPNTRRNQPQACTELCSQEISIGSMEPNGSEGYRLMDSCNGKVFTANGGNDSVTVIDTDTDSIVGTVPVGDDPRGVRCNTKTDEVWVTNWGSGTVDIIDAHSLTKQRSEAIDACLNPWGVDFTNDGSHAFVACWGGSQSLWCSEFQESSAQAALSQTFSGKSATAKAQFGKNHQQSNAPAILRDYDSNRKGPGTVEVYDANSYSHEKTLQVDSSVNGGPWGTEGCGKYMFVTNDGTDTVSVFSQKTFEKKGKIDVGEVPWDASCNEITDTLYVANGGANSQKQKQFWRNREGQASLSVIDASSLQEEKRIPTGYGKNAEPWSAAVNEQTGKVYVVDTYKKRGSVRVLKPQQTASGDTMSFKTTAQAAKPWDGRFSRGVSVSNGKVYVANTGGGEDISTKGSSYTYASEKASDGSIAVLDAKTLELEKEINVNPGKPDKNDTKPGKPEPQTTTLSLERGWNLISPPKGKVALKHITKACGVQKAFTLSGEGRYAAVNTLFSTDGYWVYAHNSCQSNITLTDSDPSQLLSAGWNLISADASWQAIQGNCQLASEGLYWYDTNTLRYKQISADTAMEPARGYWVQVAESCTPDI